jgi:hypothetical protein
VELLGDGLVVEPARGAVEDLLLAGSEVGEGVRLAEGVCIICRASFWVNQAAPRWTARMA